MKPLEGMRVGNLRVLRRADDYITPSTGHRQQQYRVLCTCGQVRIMRSCNLRSGGSTTCGIGSCRGYAAVVSYSAAHKRVKRARGAARTLACADCAGRAQEWSYQGGSPDEIVGAVTVTSRGVTYESVIAWSPNPSDYRPRCRPCHRAHDETLRTAS